MKVVGAGYSNWVAKQEAPIEAKNTTFEICYSESEWESDEREKWWENAPFLEKQKQKHTHTNTHKEKTKQKNHHPHQQKKIH